MQIKRTRLVALLRWQRIALLAWIVVALMAVGRAALIGHPRHAGCYKIYADAGRHWWAGEDLYEARSGLDLFRYSPLVASCFVPFAALPDMQGSALLRVANVGVFCAAFGCWMRWSVPVILTTGQRAALWLLALPLAVHSLVDVQTNALTVGLILLAMTAAASRHWIITAALLIFACSIKVYPLALVLLLVAMYPRQMGLRSAIAAILIFALPFLLQRPSYLMTQYRDWLRWGLNDRHSDVAALAFRDFRLLCSAWLWPLSNRAYLIAQLAAGTVIAGLCFLQHFRGVEHRKLLMSAFSLSCGWMMVFGPATEHTTYIFLAPAVAWAVLDGWLNERSLGYRIVTLGSFAVFTATQLCLWFPRGSRLHEYAPHPAAGLLLMAALAATALGQSVETRQSELMLRKAA
jgi:hypothetical protein